MAKSHFQQEATDEKSTGSDDRWDAGGDEQRSIGMGRWGRTPLRAGGKCVSRGINTKAPMNPQATGNNMDNGCLSRPDG
jgi:hypothetical protein